MGNEKFFTFFIFNSSFLISNLKRGVVGMADDAKKKKWRMHLLDELRGFAVVCMIFYHAFYMAGAIFGFSWGNTLLDIFTPAEPWFAGGFIFISGMACNLSKSNIERGVKLGLIALGITLLTYLFMPKQIVVFGILHMLASCMILYGLTEKYLSVIPIWLGMFLNIIIFTFLLGTPEGTYGIPFLVKMKFPESLYATNFLFMFGFPNKNFFSSDYFPIVPWIFLFFSGGFLGRLITKKKFPKWTAKKHIPPLAFIGRHALLFYLAHPPVIYGICWIIQWITSMFQHSVPQQ